MKLEIGDRIGRFVIIGPPFTADGKHTHNLARCDCGKEWSPRRDSIRQGRIISCGCLGLERRTRANTVHGMRPRGTCPREYNSWADMIQRCRNENSVAYAWYGARGIRVCERWEKSFSAFYEDMGPRPPGLTLERIDNNGNYEPGNCKWATRTEQMRNTRSTKRVFVDGVEMLLAAAAAVIGIPKNRIHWRVHKHGCSHQEAFDHYRAMLGR